MAEDPPQGHDAQAAGLTVHEEPPPDAVLLAGLRRDFPGWAFLKTGPWTALRVINKQVVIVERPDTFTLRDVLREAHRGRQ